MTFHIAQRLSSTFAAMAPSFGLPLVGERPHLQPGPSPVPYIFISGRDDNIVPIDGTVSREGWTYVTAAEAAAASAKVLGCDPHQTNVKTPFDDAGASVNFACTEHPHCKTGRVLTCLYDGGHHLPPGNIGEEINWWFFSQFVGQVRPQNWTAKAAS